MARKEIARVRLAKADGACVTRQSDSVAAEEPMEVRVGGKPVAVIMRTPGDDFALAAGFLFTEGVVRSFEEIEVISYCRNANDPALANIVDARLRRRVSLARLKRNLYSASSCGICGKAALELVRTRCEPIASRMTVAAETLYRLPDILRASQPIFSKTGGLHAAGLFDERGELLILKEDVGRHNAVDKVVGTALMQERAPLDRHILLVSGRESFEIVQKAAMARIPIVCGISAPSSLAVSFAREFDMTLVGLLRGRSMNVYSGERRIKF